MKKKWLFLIPVGIVLFLAVGGESVRLLWNWLAPALFGWREITFWQALGLLALCRILVGGHGLHGHRSGHRLSKRWEKMTPEEREKFRQGMGSRCGGFGAPASGTSEPA